MQTKRLISGLLASMMLFSSLNVASASEVNQVLEAGKSGNSLLYVNQEVTDFKVVVPLNLPITMDKFGTTVVANNAYIVNKSYGPIKVIDVDLEGANSWSIVGYGDDYSKMKVGSKQIGMFIQTDITKDDGTFGFRNESWNVIQGQGGRHEVIYRGKLPAQYEALEGEQVANAVFTFDWNTDLDNKTIPTEKHEEQVSTNDIGYDNNYDVVNLDLWEYEFSEEINGYILTNYVGEYIEGKIVGTVPAYISTYVVAEDNTNTKLSANNLLSIAYAEEENRVTYPVKELDSTFGEELTEAPELPNTVENLNETFVNSPNLQGEVNIPDRVGNITEGAIPSTVTTNVSDTNIDAIEMLNRLNTTMNNIPENVPAIVKGLFERTTGMTMQEFINKGYAEEGKAYDSYGNEIEDWQKYWTSKLGGINVVIKDKTLTELPTNIPVIVNQTVVTNAGNMFESSEIINLDLSNWDTTNITSLHSTFYKCKAKTINLEGLYTPNLTSLYQAFRECTVSSLDLSSFDTSIMKDVRYAFYNCPNLKTLDLSSWKLDNLENHNKTWLEKSPLTYIKVSRNLEARISNYSFTTNPTIEYVD